MLERQRIGASDEWPAAVSDGLTLGCQRCGIIPKFDYRISDEIWRKLVPENEQLGVICLPCLDNIAAATGIDFADALEEVQFTGFGQTIILRPTRIIDYSPR